MILAARGLEQSKPLQLTKGISLLLLKGLILLLFTSASISLGQAVSLNGIAHVAFIVTSVEKTREFYQKLGFDQAFAFSKDGKISQAFIKINDHQFVELYPKSDNSSKVGFAHLCFEASDLIDLDKEYRKRGLVPSELKKARAGNLLFSLVGPEEQNIEYTQYMPGSLHYEDRSKHLGKNRISKRFLDVAVAMHDPVSAEAFYRDKLSFHSINEDHRSILILPGTSGERVTLKSDGDRASPDIIFEVANVRSTTKDLRARGLSVRLSANNAYIMDPDEVTIEFSSERLLGR